MNFLIVLFIFSVAIGSCHPNSNSLRGTKWMVVEIELDSANTYDDEGRWATTEFAPSQGFYSDYRNSILINYLGSRIDTTTYRQQGNLIFYDNNKDEKLATKILKRTKDSLLVLTADGAYIQMISVDKIPN